jgi:D-threo-aldose 1-dehydrogenase
MFGTRALGNTAEPIPEQTRRAIVAEWFENVAPPVFINAAVNDGAGLETLGRALERFDIAPEEVLVNIELGDQPIHYEAIRDRWQEGIRRLGEAYMPRLASLRDPGLYLLGAKTPTEHDCRFTNVLEAYRALNELQSAGQIAAIGVCSTDWRIVQEIDAAVKVDWVMLAGSLNLMNHPTDVLDFVATLAQRQIPVINAGVFHCGFLVGSSRYGDRIVSAESATDRPLCAWRKAFVALCHGHGITPAHASIQFALSPPGIVAVALNTSHPDRVAENVASVGDKVPDSFWSSMKEEGLLAADYPYLG